MKKILSILLAAMTLASCNLYRRDSDDTIVMIGSHTLKRTQLDELTRNATSAADSAAMAEAYIRQWAGDVLFFDKATTRQDAELEVLIEQYRRELYLHRYQEQLVSKEMSTLVEEDTIRAFYEQHKDMFVLDHDIVKGLMLTVPNGAPDLQKLKKWMQQPEQNLEQIEKYAYQYATGYQLFLDHWESSTQIKMNMPLGDRRLSEMLRQSSHIETTDSLQTYLLQVTEKKLNGETMPIDFAEKDIRQIILTERQRDFVATYKQRLYDEAERSFRIHRYDEDEY